LKIIIVVKRFGLCGGMEEYAFRLSEHLVDLGVKVKILCEVQLTETSKNVVVVELGQSMKKPRWVSHIIFSNKVSNWIKNHASKNEIIHSHERINCHHITTIHSTLFNFPKRKLSFPSPRKWMNEYLEKRELSNSKVKMIVPVSCVISNQISQKYPHITSKIAEPVPPGVTPLNVKKKKYDPYQPNIGFMGTEWKRKGLTKVLEIWREIRKGIPQTKLILAGFSKSEKIGLLDHEKDKVQVLGYLEDKGTFYSKIDLLLHPAKKEAYGMVIAEASSLGIPVLCSKECGIVHSSNTHNIYSLNENKSHNDWLKYTLEILKKCDAEYNIPCKPYYWHETSLKMLGVYKSINI
jgi:glycosyltransferase involved in cell wall biosynthesis